MPLDAPVQNIETAAAPLLSILPAHAWLPWTAVPKDNGKIDKVPACGTRTNAPDTWFTLGSALDRLVNDGSVAGIGFAIPYGLIALDYDNCRDVVTGELTDEAQIELERMRSFAYVTPSRKGFRVVGRNDKITPIRGGKRCLTMPGGTSVEVFIGPTNHYVTFTHEVINGYSDIRDISSEVLDYFIGLPSTEEPESGIKEPQRGIKAIRAALHVIPNKHQNWDHWSYIGMAAWRSSGGSRDGLEAWRDWSSKHPVHNDGACDERWKHWFRSPPTKLGFGTLYHLARQANPLFVAPYDDIIEQTDYDPETGEVFSGLSGLPPESSFEATPLSALDLDHIPPRRWIYGRELIRGFVSVLASPGGTGKTAYSMATGVSVAWNKSLLCESPSLKRPPDHCVVHKQGNVWFYNLEDPMEEMRRRIKATLQHHKVPIAEVSNKIYIDSGRDRPLIVAIRAKSGDLIASPIVELLVAELKRRKIDVLIVDPFVQSHSAEENRNEEMNLVMSLWANVAHQADCAVWLIHHFRKGGKGGDAESIRGAGAIQGAARSMFTVSGMSPEEADKLGVPSDQRWQYIRHDNAKQNMAPPAGHATWYRLANVALDNGDEDYPDGDFVQAVEAWAPPSPWSGLPWTMIERVLTTIDKGPSEGEYYAAAKQARDRWAGRVLVDDACMTEGQAASVIRAWKENGVLEDGQYASPRQNGGLTGCVRVNQAKLSEMRQATPNRNTVDE